MTAPTPPTKDPHWWLRDFPSTPATVVIGLACAVLYIATALVGDLTGHPLGEATHFAMGSFISLLIGLNFAVKRITDSGYAAAKVSGPSPVTVEAPSKVTVEAPTAAPAAVKVDAPPAPSIPSPPVQSRIEIRSAGGGRVRDD